MNNFVYAADTNYNKQLFYSIYSLLNNTDRDLSLHIIHKEPVTFEHYVNKLQNIFNNFSINLYEFDIKDIQFPNIQNKHVSEATYYRLFIESIIPENIDNYIYLDADIIVINNFDEYVDEIISKLNDSNFTIACRTEYVYNRKKANFFKNLEMNSTKYFNAGVMFVNHKKWISENIGRLLLKRLDNLKDKLNYWDQDVLNSFFDGRYIELNDAINYPLDLRWPVPIQEIKEDKLFIHYQSSNKPWNIKGCFNQGSKFYQNVALSSEEKYHLVKTVRRYDLYFLIVKTLKLKFRNIDKKLNFYKEAFKIIFL